MAVALATAMTLSSVAFAEAATPGVSDPGISNPGWSDLGPGASNYEETVDLTDRAPDDEVVIGGDQGLAIVAKRKAFADSVTSVTLVSSMGTLKEEAIEPAMTAINKEARKEAKKVTDVNYGISIELYDQNGNPVEIVKGNNLEVHVSINDKNKTSNLAAYIPDGEGKAEIYTLNKNVAKNIFNFKTSHNSKYYLVKALDTGDDETTTTANGGGSSSGGFDNPGGSTGNTTTTQAPAADTTTKAPDAATTTAPGSNNNEPGSSNDDNNTTNAPDNGTSEDGNNSNVGNDGNGNGDDKNQATGVVLAVIPAAIAATAVVISKKRK